jgi:predicted Zn-ribbon and HTH transcriptional regulator
VMKILKRGNPKLLMKKKECHICSCVFVFHVSDELVHPFGIPTVKCPECGKYGSIKNAVPHHPSQDE